jgi:hypothetical protein
MTVNPHGVVLMYLVFVMITANVLQIPAILLLDVYLTLFAAMTTMLALSILVIPLKDANTLISPRLVMMEMNVLMTGVV